LRANDLWALTDERRLRMIAAERDRLPVTDPKNEMATTHLVEITQWLTVVLALSAVLSLIGKRRKTTLEMVWALFCGSLAMMTLRRLDAENLGDYQFLLGLAACATCNVFWLVARCLFRPGTAVQWPQLLFALLIAALLMGNQTLGWLHATALIDEAFFKVAHSGLIGLIGLLSSTVLVLAFWEGLRGARASSRSELKVRIIFLFTYGGCVLGCLVFPGMAAGAAESEAWRINASSFAALLIVLVTHGLVRFRLQHPLTLPDPVIAAAPSPLPNSAAPERIASSEDRALAARVLKELQAQRWYLQPELKVGGLAELLRVAEYKLSRAITLALEIPNYNQFINRYRVEHAQRLLADPSTKHWPILVIGLESGFASLGPFNRAFKTRVGTTPRDYRQACRLSTTLND